MNGIVSCKPEETWKFVQKWQHYINMKSALQSNHFTLIYASLCMISGFRHKVAENCALLGNYTESSGTRCVITQKSAILMHLWFVNCHLYVFIYWTFSSFGMLIWCFTEMWPLLKAEYIYLHFIRSYYTEVCTTETHSRMLMGESTATVGKISISTETEVLMMHKSAYSICKEFLGLLPLYDSLLHTLIQNRWTAL